MINLSCVAYTKTQLCSEFLQSFTVLYYVKYKLISSRHEDKEPNKKKTGM